MDLITVAVACRSADGEPMMKHYGFMPVDLNLSSWSDLEPPSLDSKLRVFATKMAREDGAICEVICFTPKHADKLLNSARACAKSAPNMPEISYAQEEFDSACGVTANSVGSPVTRFVELEVLGTLKLTVKLSGKESALHQDNRKIITMAARRIPLTHFTPDFATFGDIRISD
jgi:hypothetical protein